jgi:hypothetical protein
MMLEDMIGSLQLVRIIGVILCLNTRLFIDVILCLGVEHYQVLAWKVICNQSSIALNLCQFPTASVDVDF